MKIGLVHLNLSTESGDPRMFLYIAQGLKKEGHDVTIYTATFTQGLFGALSSGLDIRVIPPPVPLDAIPEPKGIMGKIKERTTRERIFTEAARQVLGHLDADLDVLLLQNDQSYKIAKNYKSLHPECVTVWIMNNAPFRHTKKNNFLVNILSWGISLFERVRVQAFKGGIDIIIVHDKEQQELGRRAGLSTEILLIPIDFSGLYRPVRKLSVKEALLIGIGSLSPTRNFEAIIRAAAILNKEGIDVHVELVCKDFWNNGEYRGFLEELVRRENIKDNVTFYFEGLPEQELAKVWDKAGIFIFANSTKLWGMSPFEAMAAGMPVLISDVTSAAEVLKDGENALFFSPSKPEEAARAVKMLLEDPAKCEAIAHAGQEFVHENLSWDSYIKTLVTMIGKKEKS